MSTTSITKPIFLSNLEELFGPCQGMVLGYNDDHIIGRQSWRWCASVLPGNNMSRYLDRRRKEGKREPFLIVLGSTLDALKRRGVPRAFYGVGLLANMNQLASDLLHPDQLDDPQNRNVNGDFKWPTGAPLLRIWQPPVPIPFSDLLGRPVAFNQSHGSHVVDIDDKAIKGIRQALNSIGLREATMVRPKPISVSLEKLLREVQSLEPTDHPQEFPEIQSTNMNGANSIVAASIRKEMQNQPLIQNTTVEVFPEAIPICEKTLRLIQRLPPEQHEKEFQKLEAARIRGEMEVPAGLGGRCDILTEVEVVEVKRYNAWRHALGQILSYGHFFPGRALRIHLFDPPQIPEDDVLIICQRYEVRVSFAAVET